MATYKKVLKNRAGDTIIPIVGQIQFDVVPFTGTRCSGNVIRSGNFGFIIGITTAFTYTGGYYAASCVLPAGVVPSGTKSLQSQATTCSHTVDDNQWTHGADGFTFGTTAATLSFPLLSGNTASKSCKVAFMLPVVFPD